MKNRKIKRFSWLQFASVIRQGGARKGMPSHSLALVVVAAFIGACASTPPPSEESQAPLVFPPPPDEPRLIFETTLFSSTQVTTTREAAAWKKMLTGEVESGEPLAKPFDVSVCRGMVFVSDTVTRRVLVFDFPRRRFFKIGEQEPGVLFKPLGVATDAQCRVYVADASLRRVMIYDDSGSFVSAVGGNDMFNQLSHVAVNADGSRLYAVDTGGVDTSDHRVRVFDGISGEHLSDIGTRGREDGQLNLPRDISIGVDGNLIVLDSGNFRVQMFDPDGNFVRKFGSAGSRYGQFSRPKGIAVDPAGNIYVTDTAFGNFQIFDQQGQLLMFVGRRSNEPGPARYMLPAGIDVDEDGRVYFVDQYFRKVDIYRPAALSADGGFLAGSAQGAASQ